MSTTNLFVELIVIGVGASIWLTLLVLALFGYDWVPVGQLLSPAAAVPLIAVVYLLGIVSDRLADAAFQRIWTDDLRGSFFKDRREYYNARRIILTQSERLSDLLEYGRSRLRICRGWAFNSVLIAVTLNMFVWMQFADHRLAWPVSAFVSVIMLALSAASWFAWRKLAMNEYRKIDEQAAFIESRAQTGTNAPTT